MTVDREAAIREEAQAWRRWATGEQKDPPHNLLAFTTDVFWLLAERADAREVLTAMVYVHPCNCGDGIPDGACARCRAVKVLGFDPALAATEGQT